MTGLPASIEAYLLETGFSQTEILVLKKLLEGEALTLRELAAKTGKSTGVLDQATKKLLNKNILSKENINDGLKYTLGSIQAITKWVEKDMLQKRDNLERKHQNFETFITSIQFDRDRPDMEYFEGEEGMKKGYMKLLECGCKEFLHYFPVECKEEEDPLCDFRVQYFRERRKRGIFSRYIIHDTPLGRRFQSRDAFEYRKTILVQPDRCPFQFEQIVCGDIFACFNHKEKKVCFIKFPQLAASERRFFEAAWQHPAAAPHPVSSTEEEEAEAKEISVQTKTLSGLREFFLSRKSVVTFVALAVLSAGVTYGLYLHNLSLNIERIREKVTSIAATGALQFLPEEVNEIRTLEDVRKPMYGELVRRLDEIRKQNDQIIYVYMLRPTSEALTYEFVVDADAPDPFAKVDTNLDGVINEADQLGVPGLKYDISDKDALSDGDISQPEANSESYSDSWGSFMTGYAPIKDQNGNVVAVLAVDMWASKIEELTQESFTPIYPFLGFFLFFVIVRFSAFNRSLAKEISRFILDKLSFKILLIALVIVISSMIIIYTNNYKLNKELVREQVRAIAATAATSFDTKDIEEIKVEADITKPEWNKLIYQLQDIRKQNISIRYVYILRPTSENNVFEFVADADSLDPYAEIDLNKDGVINEADALNPPGFKYDVSEIPAAVWGMQEPSADFDPFTDQWGTFISGFAPIKNSEGKTIAVLGVDRTAEDVRNLTIMNFLPGFLVMVFILSLILFRIWLTKRRSRINFGV